jgi:thiol:disulfide interchange protein
MIDHMTKLWAAALVMLLAWGAGGVPAGARSPVGVQLLLDATALAPGREHVLAVVLDIAPGYHTQSHEPLDETSIPFRAVAEPTPHFTWGPPVYPPGVVHDYAMLGRVSVYEGRTVIFLPATVAREAPAGPVELKVRVSWQACDDKTCFPPEDRLVSLTTRVAAAGEDATPANAEVFAGYQPGATRPAGGAGAAGPSIRPAMAPKPTYSFLGALAVAFLVGLIFNIMPCVLPVLPLKIMGFHEAAHRNPGRTIVLGLWFSAGMVTVFASLGVLVLGLRLFQWGQQFSNPWFLGGIVALLTVMAAGMFGLFSVNLPTEVYALAPRHDTMEGNFFWGMLTAVLSTPCTAPLLPPLLAWAAGQPGAVGTVLMAMVGVGMASPYVLLSAFPQAARRFPHTGPLPELVKQTLGFLLLGSAVYFAAGHILDAPQHWWATVPVAVVAGLYLMGRTVQLAKSGVGVAVAATVATAMICGTVGIAAHFNNVGAGGKAVAWEPFTPEALERAQAAGRPVLVKFTATWCLNCQYVEATVFHDAQVAKLLEDKGVLALKADLTARDAPGWPELRRLSETGGIPLTALYVPGAPEPIQLGGVYTAGELREVLRGLGRP